MKRAFEGVYDSNIIIVKKKIFKYNSSIEKVYLNIFTFTRKKSRTGARRLERRPTMQNNAHEPEYSNPRARARAFIIQRIIVVLLLSCAYCTGREGLKMIKLNK